MVLVLASGDVGGICASMLTTRTSVSPLAMGCLLRIVGKEVLPSEGILPLRGRVVVCTVLRRRRGVLRAIHIGVLARRDMSGWNLGVSVGDMLVFMVGKGG